MGAWHLINPLYTASGFGVGMLVGITGVGGGSLMTPLLVLLFGIHPATAVGTDLLYAGPRNQRLRRTRFQRRHRLARRRRLASGSVPAAALTLLALSQFGVDRRVRPPRSHDAGVRAAADRDKLLFRRGCLNAAAAFLDRRERPGNRALTMALGAVLGVLVSISSVGAGAIGVTVLLMLYPKLPIVRIVGSDIAHAVPLTLVAGAGHWWLGSVDWLLLVSLLCGSIPGIAIGSHLASRVPERVLRPLMAGTLALLGGRLVF